MSGILITGGAGFIGSHLCQRLLDEGNEVTAVDNFCTGSRANVTNLEGPRFTFIERDITDGLDDIAGPFDYVLNFASPASPDDYMKMPIETLQVGSRGTMFALELALRDKAVFMQASTSEVYGDPEMAVQNEEYWGHVNPIGPRSCYDEAKRYGEALTMAYHRSHSLDTRIVRIFNTYGPRMRAVDGRVVSNFVCQALHGENITIYGDGSQTRSFCYVDDLVEGILRLLRSNVTEPVNVGNPSEMSIKKFAEKVIELTKTESSIVYKPLPEDDPKQRKPDIQKAKKLLEWEPKVSLEEGLEKIIDYFRSDLTN